MDLERNGQNLEFLLKELHEKKAWLDRMIAGLEAALDSPQHQLIEMTERTFARKEASPKVDLQERMQAELANLAARVGAPRRPKRRKPAGKAAESR